MVEALNVVVCGTPCGSWSLTVNVAGELPRFFSVIESFSLKSLPSSAKP